MVRGPTSHYAAPRPLRAIRRVAPLGRHDSPCLGAPGVSPRVNTAGHGEADLGRRAAVTAHLGAPGVSPRVNTAGHGEADLGRRAAVTAAAARCRGRRSVLATARSRGRDQPSIIVWGDRGQGFATRRLRAVTFRDGVYLSRVIGAISGSLIPTPVGGLIFHIRRSYRRVGALLANIGQESDRNNEGLKSKSWRRPRSRSHK
jgi:hypothetical protein